MAIQSEPRLNGGVAHLEADLEADLLKAKLCCVMLTNGFSSVETYTNPNSPNEHTVIFARGNLMLMVAFKDGELQVIEYSAVQNSNPTTTISTLIQPTDTQTHETRSTKIACDADMESNLQQFLSQFKQIESPASVDDELPFVRRIEAEFHDLSVLGSTLGASIAKILDSTFARLCAIEVATQKALDQGTTALNNSEIIRAFRQSILEVISPLVKYPEILFLSAPIAAAVATTLIDGAKTPNIATVTTFFLANILFVKYYPYLIPDDSD